MCNAETHSSIVKSCIANLCGSSLEPIRCMLHTASVISCFQHLSVNIQLSIFVPIYLKGLRNSTIEKLTWKQTDVKNKNWLILTCCIINIYTTGLTDLLQWCMHPNICISKNLPIVVNYRIVVKAVLRSFKQLRSIHFQYSQYTLLYFSRFNHFSLCVDIRKQAKLQKNTHIQRDSNSTFGAHTHLI